jgi:hypothetical protein
MKRRSDDPSLIKIDLEGGMGDYAFHEIRSEDDWFVEETPDGRARWEGLPASHPLSLAYLRRPPSSIPPPLPPLLKRPLLEKSSVRALLVGVVGAACLGLVLMGIGFTRAAAAPVTSAANVHEPDQLIPVPALDEMAAPVQARPQAAAKAADAEAAAPAAKADAKQPAAALAALRKNRKDRGQAAKSAKTTRARDAKHDRSSKRHKQIAVR